MKKACIFLSCIYIVISCTSEATKTQKAPPLELPKNIIKQLKGGEIVLRKGDGILSSQLIQILNEKPPLSHCGMVIKTDTTLYIIHAISDEFEGRDGVQPCSISSFISHAIDSSIIIVKPKFSETVLFNMQQEAIKYVALNKTFDYKFNLDDTTQFYCTELLKHIFMNTVEEDIYPTRKLPNGFDNLYFQDFFNTQYFELIYTMKSFKLD